ncbi:MAG: carbamoyltransferase HypF [Zestosphaera tikiterensis]|uniref:Carbamoyltransferase n=1 Tax=Zestosphaera tikiterensis TaxID=1973259 RepID=A0A2R7Y900_9CREN|nr:MAG: carbamoyltransferase HypF [Zestosphaera tikiterensis]
MITVRLLVDGIVQGVGFRPFVHRLALKAGVKGYVKNVGGSEVEIVVQGSELEVRNFIDGLLKERPPTAVIDGLEVEVLQDAGVFNGFNILKSESKALKRSMIPPDFAICEHCLAEVLNPKDRRYRYPFNSCAWCGPRYSMMYRVPYDRENTAMGKYPLCDECLREYSNVEDLRRYHAQGISCPADGPKLWLTDNLGAEVKCDDPLKEAAKLIDEGFILAVKGLGGYHIAALATDDDVVLKLRRRKSRPTKPFAVMGLDVRTLSKLVVITPEAVEILNSPERPIVLLPKAEGSPVSKYVSPGMDVEGVFTPYTALHYLLLMETKDKFLIMTSGNPKGKPMCVSEECVYEKLSRYVDYVLVHDREIVNRVDDSVVRFTDGEKVLIRRGRGYAPKWVKVGVNIPKDVIAFGAELQSAGAVGFEDKVVLTQYIGDVDDLDTLEDLSRYLKFLLSSYKVNVKEAVVAVDKHPEYNSSRLGRFFASENGLKVFEIQHHYAHALATMADRKILGKPVAAVVVDGVGYGDDGGIWGGEVLYIDEDLKYRRIGHLQYLPFVGDESTYRPARYLVTALLKILNHDEVVELSKKYGFVKGLNSVEEVLLLQTMLKNGRYVNSSSTGRFLDAFSALLGVCYLRTYEGEPAISLEAFSRGGVVLKELMDSYTIEYGDDAYVVNLLKFFKAVVNDLSTYLGSELMKKSLALTTQYGLGYSLGTIVAKALDKGVINVNHLVLGGGAAVNDYLVKGVKAALKDYSIKTLLPREIPPNDGGIPLGQVIGTIPYL